MKLFTLLATAAGLLATSNAYVVEMFPDKDCGGEPVRRNIYDNTCAYTKGFQSIKLKVNGGNFQQIVAYSPQSCAGTQTFSGCSSGIRSLELEECHNTVNGDGGSNALSSYSNAGPCPN